MKTELKIEKVKELLKKIRKKQPKNDKKCESMKFKKQDFIVDKRIVKRREGRGRIFHSNESLVRKFETFFYNDKNILEVKYCI